MLCGHEVCLIYYILYRPARPAVLVIMITVTVMPIVVVLGYGIFATKDFSPGDFLLEYVGDIIDPSAADKLVDQTYVYYFSWASKKYRLALYY